MPAPIALVRRITKKYGDFEAVNDLSLDINEGEVLSLLGPNGAGKTTTIRMLMGILRPTSGTATIKGLDCFSRRAYVKRFVGYLPDDPIFYDYLTGRELLYFIGSMHGYEGAEISGRTAPLAERLSIAADLDEFAVNYSRGMKKKLALIAALLHDPDLLILDEPTYGLDPFATRTVREIMREKAAEGKSVFYSTHLLDQAERVSDRIGILHKGRLAAIGTLEELREGLAEGSSLEEVFFAVAGDAGPAGELP